MAMQRDTLLGLVFFGGLALLGWATVSLTSLSLEPKVIKTVRFAHAQGLREGDPVFVLGKRLGQVNKISLPGGDVSRQVEVVFQLDEDIPLRPDARITVRPPAMLGNSYIEIDPGVTEGALAGPLVGDSRGSALDQIGDADVTGTVDSVKRFFDRLVDPDNAVGALLSSREAYDDLAAALAVLRRLLEEVETGEGAIHQLLYNRDMGEDLAGTARNLNQLTEKLDSGSGLFARLANDPALADDLASALDDLAALVAMTRRGEGTLGRVWTDEELADRIAAAITSLQSVAAKLDDPDAGFVGALFGDQTLLQQGREIFADVADAVAKINSGDGFLAKIINDNTLGERLERLFLQVTGALEDAREAAPIGSFFQVLTGFF